MDKLVYAYIQKLHMLQKGDCVTVGLSGGADSVCLLYVLHKFEKALGFSLKALHIHHGLRKEADKEAEFTRELCALWDIPYCIKRVDVTGFQKTNRIGTEEAARLLRYELFEKEIQAGGKVALAHHKNDQAETVLFHLFRGSNMKGLCGMQPIRGGIIRPLLCVTRKEIEAFLKAREISFVTDQSNFDTGYARNSIRHEILPLAEEKISNKAAEHICAGADSVRLALDFLETEIQAAFEKHVVFDEEGGCYIEKAAFEGMHPYLKSEVLYRMLVKTCNRQKDISKVHIDALLNLLEMQSGRSLKLIYQTCAYTDQHRLFIQKDSAIFRQRADDSEEQSVSAKVFLEKKEADFVFGAYRIKFRIFPYSGHEDIPNGSYTKWFDYDKINTDLSLRYRRSGDYFFCTGDSRKKVQDYMVEQKIPSADRSRIPLLADDDHIVWIIGYRISEYYKVTDKTKFILEAAAEKENQNE